MKKIRSKPILIKGDTIFDNRGSVKFCNKITLHEIRRFYIINNYNKNFIRAWHGHFKEAKYITCIKGAFQVSCVKLTDKKKPSRKESVQTWYLSERKKEILYIPPKYANGTMSLIDNSELLVLSNSSLKESIKDDYRYPVDYWNPWVIKFR